MNVLDPILITGAAGFVGSALVNALQDRPLRRALRKAAPDARAGDFVIGNIGPASDWREALQGIDCVIHLAARTHVLREFENDPLASYRLANVDATRNIALQAAAAGVRRFVFLSSVKVNGEFTETTPFTENDPPRPLDAYGRSKQEAEDLLRQIGKETGMEIVILRPPLVYGPGVKGNFLRLLKLVDRETPLPLASVHNLRSLVFINNLVDAILACVETPAAAGKTYLVSDGEDVSTPELVRRMALALDRRPRLLPCPVSLLHLGGTVLGKRDEIQRLTGSLQVNSRALREDLGWRPRFSLDQGLIATARWYHRSPN